MNTLPADGGGTALHAITPPGSYYLSENLLGAAGKYGILIASDNVDCDVTAWAIEVNLH